MADRVAFPNAEDTGEEWAGAAAPSSQSPLFCIEQVGQTLIVIPKISGKVFRYTQLRNEANALRRKLSHHSLDGLILDLHASITLAPR